jgi:predicted DNA binding CopG/RHH family protein
VVKKKSELLVHAKQIKKNVKHIPDKDLDFSDIPESTSAELKKARRVGRPCIDNAKQLIAIRIEPLLLNKIKTMAQKNKQPYQTFMQYLLAKAVKKTA